MPTSEGAARTMSAWVYLLRCADDSLYCGWTVDVEQRLARHAGGRASRYTRARLPVELAWSQELPDRTAARREEARIKALPRADKLALAAQPPGTALASLTQSRHGRSR